MKPITIFPTLDNDGYVRLTKEEFLDLVTKIYEAGKAERTQYGGLLTYPTGVCRPGEDNYIKIRYSGDSNDG